MSNAKNAFERQGTAKKLDEETGLYYYGARYLDPKYSMWLSTDPALSEYIAGSSVGCGGIYNHINLNLYHYAGNNPIKYIDPTGYDDLYYDEYGNYLKTEISDTTNVYLSNNGSDTLVGSQTDFDTMAAAYGGTIFWKKSDEYRRIMQERAFTR